MQISSIAAPASPATVEAPRPPAALVFREYLPAFMALSGVVSTGWGASEPDAVRLSVQGPELAFLADQALADVVDGVRLVITDRTGGGPVADDSWVRNPANVMRALASLPGVVDWNRLGGYMLIAESRERAAWLRKVVSPTLMGTPLRVIAGTDLP